MKLSEAILLGDSLKSPDPRFFLSPDGSRGCAIGGAALAVGIRGFIAHPTSSPEVMAAFPWITFAHCADISLQYVLVCKGWKTIEQLADFVRSIEPTDSSAPILSAGSGEDGLLCDSSPLSNYGGVQVAPAPKSGESVAGELGQSQEIPGGTLANRQCHNSVAAPPPLYQVSCGTVEGHGLETLKRLEAYRRSVGPYDGESTLPVVASGYQAPPAGIHFAGERADSPSSSLRPSNERRTAKTSLAIHILPSRKPLVRSAGELLPCATCPWRVDKDATTIPRYSHEKAVGLLNTVGEGDAFRPIMACHHSGQEMFSCRGYLAKAGWSNLNVRLLLAKGEIENPGDVLQECEAAGVELHESYEDVLDKLSNSLTAQSTGNILDVERLEEIEAEREGSDLGGYPDPADNPRFA